MDFPDDIRSSLLRLSELQFSDLLERFEFSDEPFLDVSKREERYLQFRKIWPIFDPNGSRYEELRQAIRDVVLGVTKRSLTSSSPRAALSVVNWQPAVSLDDLEKIMGTENTLLPIHFLEQALACSRSVAKIVLADGSSGSGFVIQGNLLVTNSHVIQDSVEAEGASVWFDFQKNLHGRDLPVIKVNLNPSSYFRTSKEDDLTVVELGEAADGRWSELDVIETSVKERDRVCIIQHPAGGQKHIGMYHNLVTYANDHIVQYLTDTLPGSSGSPVFDRNWKLVAIHHSGGWLRQPNVKEDLFRNEGISVTRLLHLLK